MLTPPQLEAEYISVEYSNYRNTIYRRESSLLRIVMFLISRTSQLRRLLSFQTGE